MSTLIIVKDTRNLQQQKTPLIQIYKYVYCTMRLIIVNDKYEIPRHRNEPRKREGEIMSMDIPCESVEDYEMGA